MSERDWRAEIEAVRARKMSLPEQLRDRDALLDAMADEVDRDRGEIARLRARLERVEGAAVEVCFAWDAFGLVDFEADTDEHATMDTRIDDLGSLVCDAMERHMEREWPELVTLTADDGGEEGGPNGD